jgi:hypothetical protein
MRLILAMMLAALVALPLSAGAQAAEEGATPEPSAEEPAPSAEPAPEEPALQLKLDAAGLDVAPSPQRTPDRYTLKEMKLRVKRAAFGFGFSGAVFFTGAVLVMSPFIRCDMIGGWTKTCDRLAYAGIAVVSAGAVATIATGILYGVRNRKLRRRKRREWDTFRHTHSGTPRRVQWDLARSRLVF